MQCKEFLAGGESSVSEVTGAIVIGILFPLGYFALVLAILSNFKKIKSRGDTI